MTIEAIIVEIVPAVNHVMMTMVKIDVVVITFTSIQPALAYKVFVNMDRVSEVVIPTLEMIFVSVDRISVVSVVMNPVTTEVL